MSDDVKEFGGASVQFKIAGELYEGKPDIPPIQAMELHEKWTTVNEQSNRDEQAATLRAMFNLILKEESYERFMATMEEPDSPIGVNVISELVPWLLEQYGLRPTEPSSHSSRTSRSRDDGTNSTDDSHSTTLMLGA